MTRLTRLAGLAADVALGLPVRAAEYEIHEDVPVPMPGGPLLQPPGKQADNKAVEERGDGVSRNVVDGIRRLDPRTLDAPDIVPGADGVLAVAVELFPTAYRFRAGHRVRVQVSGGAFPRYARNMGTPEPFGTATTGRACRFEVFHDGAHPSHIALPVRPDS